VTRYCGNSSLWSGDHYVDLRSAALRAKRPAVFDCRSALLAGVFHVFEKLAHNGAESKAARDQ
jgi:hypothetical protein